MAQMHSISDDKQSVRNLNLAKLKKEGARFEIAIDCDAAVAFKEGKDVDIRDIVKSQNIFADVQKGELASEERMKAVFGTSDSLEIAKVIITEGEIQLTAEHRTRQREAKRKKIITMIARDAIDPKTKLPHPPDRVELALQEAKVHINEFQTAEAQMGNIVKQLRPILPISFEKKILELTIPGTFAGKAQNPVRKRSSIKAEDWSNDGSWIVTVELSGGAANELSEELNNLTHGNVKIKDIK